MPTVKQNVPKFNNPTWVLLCPRLTAPSYGHKGHAASPKYPKEALIRHPLQTKDSPDTFPSITDNFVKSLNYKTLFFMGSRVKLNFLIDLFPIDIGVQIYSIKSSAQPRQPYISNFKGLHS